MDRDDVLDALLALLALGLHLAAAGYQERLPPDSVLDVLLVVVPALAIAAAVVLLVVRRDRRGLQVACTLEWLLVLFMLPAFFMGLAYVPAAAALTAALVRPRLSSGRPVAG